MTTPTTVEDRDTATNSAANSWIFSARLAAAVVVCMSAVNAAVRDTGFGDFPEFIAGACLGLAMLLISLGLLSALRVLLGRLPSLAVFLLSGSLLALWLLFNNAPTQILALLLNEQSWSLPSTPSSFSVASLWVIALGIAATLSLLILGRRGVVFSRAFLGFAFSAGILALILLLKIGSAGGDPFMDGTTLTAMQSSPGFDDPSQSGTFEFSTLTYGAGPNARRPEFGSQRDLLSRTVDARAILPEWRGFKASMREKYWGFDLEQAPLNGTVWMPDGDGPFPLILIVHGNHGMEDFSDDGYAYLGELLASRGFIAVSVDQNYINGTWSGDFRGREMAARAWLLLEHLALWRDWNADSTHAFSGRVDMQQIALIGHSRGGEAVAIAHRFNELPFFPDDARVAFDYNFDIQSLVAIAQVDQRYHRRVQLQDVNFFTIHGSYDSDEPAYHGLRQMNRIGFSGQDHYLKAGVYLHGANHGQFNTGWGRSDFSAPGSWTLNKAPIIPGVEQRQAAKVFISAFLEATLAGKSEYLDLLREPRWGTAWLPQQTFVHQFQDSSFHAIADFDEDIDASTASQPGWTIESQKLLRWREEELRHRDKRLQGSNALAVGWRGKGASLTIKGADSLDLTARRALVFAVSGSMESLPSPETGAESGTGDSETAKRETPAIPDFSIELRDNLGRRAQVRVSAHAQLIAPVRVQYLKNQAANKANYNAVWEPILQHVEIPLEAFAQQRSGLNLTAVSSIQFRFDQEDEGALILDEVGFADGPIAASAR